MSNTGQEKSTRSWFGKRPQPRIERTKTAVDTSDNRVTKFDLAYKVQIDNIIIPAGSELNIRQYEREQEMVLQNILTVTEAGQQIRFGFNNDKLYIEAPIGNLSLVLECLNERQIVDTSNDFGSKRGSV